MTKRKLSILLVSLTVFILIVFRLFSGEEAGAKGPGAVADNNKYVKVQKVKNDTLPLIVHGFGRVSSSHSIVLSAEVQGLLMPGSAELKPGKSISKGQLLFKINDVEAQLALKARKSSFLNLVASVIPDIKIDFADNLASWNGFLNSIDLEKPLPEIPNFKSNKEKTFLASKNVLSEYFNIKGDEERIRKYSVYAPFDGTIQTVTSEVGTIVNPGSPVATIIKTVALEVSVPVDPKNISLIKEGDDVDLFSEDKKMKWSGKVARIAQFLNPNTQSIDVYVSVKNNEKHSLYNGMYLEANIYGELANDVDEIPRRAFLNDGKIYTVKDSILTRRSLSVVKYNKNSMIVSGLSDGELVVIEPIPGAVDSMKVAPIINKSL